jgi:hypothetical protein
MRRSTTSAATKRPLLGLLLLVELVLGVLLIGRPAAAPPEQVHTPPTKSITATAVPTTTVALAEGRSAHMIGLGGQRTAALLARIAAEMGGAADAVTAFWGSDWPRAISIVAAGSDAQFRAMAGGLGADSAAAAVADYVDPERRTVTGQRIVFAPGAAAMSEGSLRIVLRHELFHFAARADTALDAPQWLTEGVADFVGRSPTPRPPNAADLAQLPTDADLDAVGPTRSLTYDRAWWFSRFVADRYGPAALRELYLRACGPRHPDVATAVRDTLGAELSVVLNQWRQWMTGLPNGR